MQFFLASFFWSEVRFHPFSPRPIKINRKKRNQSPFFFSISIFSLFFKKIDSLFYTSSNAFFPPPLIIIMSSILKCIQRIVVEEVSSVIYNLSQKYDFNFDEEHDAFLANFALSNKTQKIKQPKPLKEKPLKDNDKSPKWKLPFNGTISHSLCHAICRADGLYIQCKKTPFAESDLCKTCQNYMLKNDKLPYGRIEERAEVGLYEFRFGKYSQDW